METENEAKQMICPIMSASKPSHEAVKCRASECMWWVEVNISASSVCRGRCGMVPDHG